MPTIYFYGKVLPKGVEVTLPEPIRGINADIVQIGLKLEFTLSIDKNVIRLVGEASHVPMDWFAAIHARALDVCRGAVDVVAFAAGVGLVTVLENFVDDMGRDRPIIGGGYDFLPGLCTAFDGVTARDIREFVWRSPDLSMALHDLIAAVTIPQDLRRDCNRAMDGLKRLIAPDEQFDKAAWKKMQYALRADEAYLKLITEHGKSQRHGKHTDLPGDLAHEIVRRSWNVMNRYFEYLKRGSTPLPESEFPWLKG